MTVSKQCPKAIAMASLGSLFGYPDEETVSRARRVLATLPRGEAATHLERFVASMSKLSLGQLHELHSKTFSLAPSCIPYSGVYLFGEGSFKRGSLLAELMDQFRRRDFDPEGELPDHVGVLLRFSSLLDADEVDELVDWLLAKPLSAMSEALRSGSNPYRHLVEAVRLFVAPQGASEEVCEVLSGHARSALEGTCSTSWQACGES